MIPNSNWVRQERTALVEKYTVLITSMCSMTCQTTIGCHTMSLVPSCTVTRHDQQQLLCSSGVWPAQPLVMQAAATGAQRPARAGLHGPTLGVDSTGLLLAALLRPTASTPRCLRLLCPV